ncbi:MAG: DNA polymerase III subunit delta [Candidatus Stahlbacteria bacterium]|nr:DNA polymerase III subunit delta [Candidatus Stahlbacteria bacterium]
MYREYKENEYQRFVREVKEGKIRHGYLLLKENDFLKERLVKDIESKIINPHFSSTDKLFVYGDSASPDIISFLNQPPFGSKKKLLVIKNADTLPEKLKLLIQKWLDHPSSTTVLVLMANVKKKIPDDKKKIPDDKKEVIKDDGFKNIPTCDCEKIWDNKVPGWAMAYVREQKFSITYEAIGFLQEFFSTDIQALATELDKLMSFISPRKNITLADAKEMESQDIANSVYDFAHSIANRDFVKASKFLNLLFDFNEKPTSILWQIYNHFDKLMKLKIDPKSSYGIHKYYLPKYQQQSKLWSESELLTAFSYIFRADLSIKTGEAEPKFVVSELAYKLCNIKSSRVQKSKGSKVGG